MMRCIIFALLILSSSLTGAEQKKEKFHRQRLIVKYKEGAGPQAIALVPGLTVMQLQEGEDPLMVQEELKKNSQVEYAEPDYELSASDITPNDPLFNSLWGMPKISAPNAWDLFKGVATTIAVIDTGVDYNHPDLIGNLWKNPGEIAGNGKDDDGNGYIDDIYGYDFCNKDSNPMDDNNHGTHVSGTIAGRANNGIGVVGVNWNAKIMSLKFLCASGFGYTSDAILALNYAVAKGAQISNNSWGGADYSQSMANAITNARNKNHIAVFAAGNNGSNNDNSPYYPASYGHDNLVAVAATTPSDSLATFSNYGATYVDLGAPGAGVQSTLPGNNYGSYSGTSMATPHVVGALSLVWGLYPTMNYKQVIAQVVESGDSLSSLQGKTLSGRRLNVYRALTQLPATPVMVAVKAESSQRVRVEWSDSGNTRSGYQVERGTSPNSFTLLATVEREANRYYDETAQQGMVYYYRVRSFNPIGNSSYSNPMSLIPLAAPTNLSGTVLSSSQVALNWNATGNVSGFEVEWKYAIVDNFTLAGTSSATSFVYTNLKAGMDYEFRVRAYGPNGNSSYSNVITVSTQKPPVPVIYHPTVLSTTQMVLEWSGTYPPGVMLSIERGTVSTGPFVQVAQVDAGTTSWIDNGVTANKRYYYRARASNLFGYSVYSAIVNGKTSVPPAPTTLAVSAPDSTRVKLTWVDPSVDERGFIIQRSHLKESDYIDVGYTDPNTKSFEDPSGYPDQNYYYRVIGYNAIGNSLPSNVAYVRQLAQPTSMVATLISTTKLNLTWEYAGTGHTGFVIDTTLNPAGTWTRVSTPGPAARVYLVTPPNVGVKRYYRVRAYRTPNSNSNYAETSFTR